MIVWFEVILYGIDLDFFKLLVDCVEVWWVMGIVLEEWVICFVVDNGWVILWWDFGFVEKLVVVF